MVVKLLMRNRTLINLYSWCSFVPPWKRAETAGSVYLCAQSIMLSLTIRRLRKASCLLPDDLNILEVASLSMKYCVRERCRPDLTTESPPMFTIRSSPRHVCRHAEVAALPSCQHSSSALTPPHPPCSTPRVIRRGAEDRGSEVLLQRGSLLCVLCSCGAPGSSPRSKPRRTAPHKVRLLQDQDLETFLFPLSSLWTTICRSGGKSQDSGCTSAGDGG